MLDDAVIAQSWQQPERFAVLFNRHAPYIHRYIARRVRVSSHLHDCRKRYLTPQVSPVAQPSRARPLQVRVATVSM